MSLHPIRSCAARVIGNRVEAASYEPNKQLWTPRALRYVLMRPQVMRSDGPNSLSAFGTSDNFAEGFEIICPCRFGVAL